MEIFWLIVAIGSTIYVVYRYQSGQMTGEKDYLLFMAPVVAGFSYGMRRFFRIKMEQKEKNQR